MNEPELIRRIQAYRGADNLTNWLYLGRTYVFLAVVFGLTAAWHLYRVDAGLGWGWDIPAVLAAIFLIGIGQHHLAVLGHDGSHGALFRNRWLNELASDWLCFFPLFGTTQNYRLQHMPHHQHTNDPDLDPDWKFLHLSGHGHQFRHPMPRGQFWWRCIVRPILWAPGLLAYVFVRGYAVVLGGSYTRVTRPRWRLVGLEFGYLGAILLATLFASGPARWLIAVGAWATLVIVTCIVPGSWYPTPWVKPVLPQRLTRFMRQTYMTVLFLTLAYLTEATGRPWFLLWFGLWCVPMITSFAFLMILRDEMQHSNAGTGRYKHTRVYEGNWLVRQAVFPMGMDYHLPHHLFPNVPHYHLKQVHEILRENERYRREVVVLPAA